jgi:hypothetical protein
MTVITVHVLVDDSEHSGDSATGGALSRNNGLVVGLHSLCTGEPYISSAAASLGLLRSNTQSAGILMLSPAQTGLMVMSTSRTSEP